MDKTRNIKQRLCGKNNERKIKYREKPRKRDIGIEKKAMKENK